MLKIGLLSQFLKPNLFGVGCRTWHTKEQYCCGTKVNGAVASDWFSVSGKKKKLVQVVVHE